MKTIKTLLLPLVLCAFASAQAIDAPGGDDTDLAGGGDVAVITWEPIITEFYAMSEHGTGAVVHEKTATNMLPGGKTPQDILGEVNQWRMLRPVIAPRTASEPGKPAYTDKEPVLSAWQRTADKDGRIVFVTFGSAAADAQAQPGEPAPAKSIHTIYAQDHNILFSCDIDVLTNAPAADKDRILNYFRIKQYQVYAHKVSDDPTRFRDAVAPDAQTIKIRAYPENQVTTPLYTEVAHAYARPTGGFNVDLLQSGMGENGVWEFRVKVVVIGKLAEVDTPVEKEVEGAIRVAFVKDKQMEVRVLNRESQRKPGEYDYIIGRDGKKIPLKPAQP